MKYPNSIMVKGHRYEKVTAAEPGTALSNAALGAAEDLSAIAVLAAALEKQMQNLGDMPHHTPQIKALSTLTLRAATHTVKSLESEISGILKQLSDMKKRAMDVADTLRHQMPQR